MSDLDVNEPLVEVWRAWGEAEARIIQGLLEASGIVSALRGESTRLTHGFTLDGLAEVRILVREQDAARATEVISEAGEMNSCPECSKAVRIDDVHCRFCKAPLGDG
jgi:hypothetical protein